MMRASGGDARRLLNILEMVVQSTPGKVKVTNTRVKELIQNNVAGYDKAVKLTTTS